MRRFIRSCCAGETSRTSSLTIWSPTQSLIIPSVIGDSCINPLRKHIKQKSYPTVAGFYCNIRTLKGQSLYGLPSMLQKKKPELRSFHRFKHFLTTLIFPKTIYTLRVYLYECLREFVIELRKSARRTTRTSRTSCPKVDLNILRYFNNL